MAKNYVRKNESQPTECTEIVKGTCHAGGKWEIKVQKPVSMLFLIIYECISNGSTRCNLLLVIHV